MGCFLCPKDKKKQEKKKKSSSEYNRHKRDDHAQSSPDKKETRRDYSKEKDKKNTEKHSSSENSPRNETPKNSPRTNSPSENSEESNPNKLRSFSFHQLVEATQDFKPEYYLGEGGFGKVYKGYLPDTGEVVAIKQLDRNGCQGIREFVVEVITLGSAHHPNLVKLLGYCVDGDQRLLVYEYMPLGSLEGHLHVSQSARKKLDWNTRMKIAAGAAQGLEYLHDKLKKPIIYRDLKCSNILLGEGYYPKLSDFGLAKLGPLGDKTHVSTRVMGTYGYCAPDYAMTGQLTFKSDIYSFGVVLLEIITGRMAIDSRRSRAEENLVAWAKPIFKDRRKFHMMADPALEGRYPVRGLYQALAIAAMCVQEKPSMRPLVADVVTALNYLASQKYDPAVHGIQDPRRRTTHSSPPSSSSSSHRSKRPSDECNRIITDRNGDIIDERNDKEE